MIYLQWTLYDGNGRKTPKCNKTNLSEIPHWLPSHPPVYEIEADCFPVFENTENKPDLP